MSHIAKAKASADHQLLLLLCKKADLEMELSSVSGSIQDLRAFHSGFEAACKAQLSDARDALKPTTD